MKKLARIILSMALALTLLASATVTAFAAPASPKLSLSKNAVTILVDDQSSIDEIIDIRVSWSFPSALQVFGTDPEVAIVDSFSGNVARIRATGIGKTNIVFFDATGKTGAYAVCTVTVALKPYASSIALYNENNLNKKLTSAKVQLDAIQPDTLYSVACIAEAKGQPITTPDAFSKYFIIENSNPQVIGSVELANGAKKLEFHLQACGDATVTIKAKDNPKVTAKLKLSVVGKAPVSKITLINDEELAPKKKFVIQPSPAANELQLGATVVAAKNAVPSIPALAWASSNPGVATVDENGKVTFRSAGSVKITASATDGSKKSATIAYSVSVANKADHVSVTNLSDVEIPAVIDHTMHAGIPLLLFKSAAMTGEDKATVSGVTVKSSAPKIAEISGPADNGDFSVRILKPGKAKITVTAIDGSKKSKAFTINAKANAVVSIAPDHLLNHDGKLLVQAGSITKLWTAFEPADLYDQGLTYKSSKPKVASVDKDGYLTAIAAGETVITVTTKAKTADKKPVTVKYALPVVVEGHAIKPFISKLAVTTSGYNTDENTPKVGDTMKLSIETSAAPEKLAIQWYTKQDASAVPELIGGATQDYLEVTSQMMGRLIGVNVVVKGDNDEDFVGPKNWQSAQEVSKYVITKIEYIKGDVNAEEPVIADPDVALKAEDKLTAVVTLDGKYIATADDANIVYTWTNTATANTSNTHTVVPADIGDGKKISLTVSLFELSNYLLSEAVTNTTWAATKATYWCNITGVTLTGDLKYPGTIKAVLATDIAEPPAIDSLDIAWSRLSLKDGGPIATKLTPVQGKPLEYQLVEADVGATIAVSVSGKSGSGIAGSGSIERGIGQYMVKFIKIHDQNAMVVNEPLVGETLYVYFETDKDNASAESDCNWYTGTMGMNGIEWSAQAVSTDFYYEVVNGDVGKYIKAEFKLEDFAYPDEADCASYTTMYPVIKGSIDEHATVKRRTSSTETVDFTGAPIIGDVLVASTKNATKVHEERTEEVAVIMSAEAATLYTWYRGEGDSKVAIDGASGADKSEYTVVEADMGQKLSVEITKAGFYNTAKWESSEAAAYNSYTVEMRAKPSLPPEGSFGALEGRPEVGLRLAYRVTPLRGTAGTDQEWQYKDANGDYKSFEPAVTTPSLEITTDHIGQELRLVVRPSSSQTDYAADYKVAVPLPKIPDVIKSATLLPAEGKSLDAPLIGDVISVKVLTEKGGETPLTEGVVYAWNYNPYPDDYPIGTDSAYMIRESDLSKHIAVTVSHPDYSGTALATATGKVTRPTTLQSAILDEYDYDVVTFDLSEPSLITKADISVTVGGTPRDFEFTGYYSGRATIDYELTLVSPISPGETLIIAPAVGSKILSGGSITVYAPPNITFISFTSNASNPMLSKAGDILTLKFSISAEAKVGAVLIQKNPVTATLAEGVYTATHTITVADQDETSSYMASYSIEAINKTNASIKTEFASSAMDVAIAAKPQE